MTNNVILNEFDWQAELEKTVVNSLVTTFGLDFIFFQDKKGGDVDTIHKTREWQKEIQNSSTEDEIHISNELRKKFNSSGKNKEDYKYIKRDSDGNPILNNKGKEIKEDKYHTDHRFKNKANLDKNARIEGNLHDAYRNQKMEVDTQSQLDHIISSHEIHNDGGRILANLDGVDLSVQDSNLASTHYYVNNRKSNMTIEEFVYQEIPKIVEKKKSSIAYQQEKLKTMPEDTPEQRHKKRQVEDSIRKEKEHLKALEEVDKEAMLEADRKARADYNNKINFSYYTSSKFFKSTAMDMGKKGLAMGARQALGLVLTEVWFELREQIPVIYQKSKHKFDFKIFLDDISKTLKRIWERVKDRFRDFFATFKDGAIAGALSSLNTTLFNIFLVSEKMIVKMIREMWNSLVGIIKLIVFNPNKLLPGDLLREALKLLSLGISTLLGTMLNTHLTALLTFPFGAEISAFLGALATGVLTLGFSYFLEHSEIMRKVWDFINKFGEITYTKLDQMRDINAELDRYLLELAKLELNMNPQELQIFSDSLVATNNEFERSFILKAEIERRNIKLPFESGNLKSVKDWLKSKQ